MDKMKHYVKRKIEKILSKIGERKGLPPFFSKYYLPILLMDYKMATKEERPTLKKWHKRGFMLNSIRLYHLTDENYTNYLSDLTYYQLYPINKVYSKWIDDKLTFSYMFRKFHANIPEHYLQIQSDGRAFPLPDAPEYISRKKSTAENIIMLLKDKERLFLKRIQGTRAYGVMLLEYREGKFFVKRMETPEEELVKILNEMSDYLVQEYLTTSSELPKNTLNIRVCMVNLNGEEPVVGYAFMLVKEEDYDEKSIYQGDGILGNVQADTGKYDVFYTIKYKGNSISDSEICKEDIKIGTVPRWNQIIEKLKEVCRYVPQLSYLGIDIIVTEDDFKILEINSHSSLVGQLCQPYMVPGTNLELFFTELLSKRHRQHMK